MAEQRSRPTRRARIDTIVAAVRKGEYDDRLGELRDAVEGRYAQKREEVLLLVKEVFGDRFTIAQEPAPNPFMDRTESEAEAAHTPIQEVEIVSALPRAAEPAFAAGSDAENDPAIESRSPIIGSGQ